MEHDERDEHLACAAPRVAAAAAPHKRRAVAAGTDVGEAVGVADGKLPAGGEGEDTWTTVLSRRARRLAKAHHGVTSSGAARKAAAARAAATRRTATAILEHAGMSK